MENPSPAASSSITPFIYAFVKVETLLKCLSPKEPYLLCPDPYRFPSKSVIIECQFPAEKFLTFIFKGNSLGIFTSSYDYRPSLPFFEHPQPNSSPFLFPANRNNPPELTLEIYCFSSSGIFFGTGSSLFLKRKPQKNTEVDKLT